MDKEFYNCHTDDCFDCPNYETCIEGIQCPHFHSCHDCSCYNEEFEICEYDPNEDQQYPESEYDYSDELMDMEFEDRISGEY